MMIMNLFAMFGNYFTTGAHVWYLLVGVPLLMILALVFLPKNKELQQQMYPQGMYTFGAYTFKTLTGGVFLIVIGVISLLGPVALAMFEQEHFDSSVSLFQRGSVLLGIGCVAIIIVGMIITYIGWRQYRNKRPDQNFITGPFN
jgi:hypothetical protein